MLTLNIDPGNIESAYLIMLDGKIHRQEGFVPFGKVPNETLLDIVRYESFGAVVCEEIRSYGMAVGQTIFDTVRWTGRYQEAALFTLNQFHLVGRQEVKLHWCKSSRAKDANVRQALIDFYGEPGTKKTPGNTYGISADVWSALAIAGYWHYQHSTLHI